MNNLVEARRRLETMSVDELADWAASIGPNSDENKLARAEFLRRQTAALEDTAEYTRRGALAMIVSAVVLTLSAIIGGFFAYRRLRRRPNGSRQQGGQNRSRLQSPGEK